MNDISNKASICAIVYLVIIDFSKKTDSEQAALKNQLNSLINHAVIDIAQKDRAILDVADGAAIACIGLLEEALEDALFISLTIRDEILENNSLSPAPLYVRFGINLGAVRVFSDINGKPSIVGEGIEEAQRIMSFAKPNQILVSRPYYEMTSKLSPEISQMFEYNDMHAHEHELYSVRLLKDQAAIEELPSVPADNLPSEKWQAITSKINWSYAALSLLVFAGLFVLVKLVTAPAEPTITLVQPAAVESPVNAAIKPAKSDNEALLPEKSLENSSPQASSDKAQVVKKIVAQKKAKQKTVPEAKAETKTETPANVAVKPVESKIEKVTEKDKSGWDIVKDSVKQGAERQCSQAEIAMNQCR
jgi:class 3 adenylate cyclase